MLLSLRIGGADHRDQAYIDDLINALVECGTSFDEVWIATSYGLPSVKQCEAQVPFMQTTAEKFAKIGITPSMQISRTIGHGPSLLALYGSDGIKDLNCNFVKTVDGGFSGGRICCNNEAFQNYIYDSMKAYAAWKPAIVWVDDDLRLLTTGNICYCDKCISDFNKQYGYSYTFETLRDDFLHNNPQTRKDYVDFQTGILVKFAHKIAQAIHEASPDTVMALQNGGWTPLSTIPQAACLEEMKNVSGKEYTGFRAGGGFYNDHDPIKILDKALNLNYLHSCKAEHVKLRNCEIENLPFVSFGKSHEATCLEAAIYMAYGCNMASVTIMNRAETLDYHKRMIKRLVQYRPYLERMVQHNEGSVNGGLAIYQSPNMHLAYYEEDSAAKWLSSPIFDVRHILRWGIPVHAGAKGNVLFLNKNCCDHMLPEDVDALLHQPVITEAKAIESLIEMGFFDAFPITVRPVDDRYHLLVYEKPVDHPINNGITFKSWSNSYYFSKEIQYVIEGDNIEAITNCHSMKTNENLGCAMAVIETKYGAKWFIFGSHLSNPAISSQRRNQIVNALNYIAKAPLPAYSVCTDQVVVIPRVNNDGKTVSVTLFNCCVTDAEDVKIAIHNPANTESYTLIDPYAADQELPLSKENDHYSIIIDEIRAWRVKTILL